VANPFLLNILNHFNILNHNFSPPMLFRIHTNTTMLYSLFDQKQPARNSQNPGWQPVLDGQLICTSICGEERRKGTGTTLFCNMKNSLKTTGASVARGLQVSPQETEDYPFIPEPNSPLPETRTPEEESFRTLLRNNLPRHTAPQALQDRIRRSIKNMPD
jgi:hypothetical protein